MNIKKIIKENYKFIIFLIIFIGIFYIKLPYYILAPGGSINITDRVEMNGYVKHEGSLNMLYVSEYESTPWMILYSKIMGYDIYNNKERKISSESVSDVKSRNKIMRDNSLDIATLVAYTEANKKINIKSSSNVVVAVTNDNGLKVGDIILEIDNKNCKDINDIRKIIMSKDVGDTVKFKVKRNNNIITINSNIILEDDAKIIGAAIVTEYDYDIDPEINIKFKNSESGSSGGLMLTLTIYNAISDEDIIKGRNIAGTGTISSDGSVGEIDGIKYKIMGAAKDNMDIVFVPSANYDEAIATKNKYKYDLDIVKVDTFEETLNYLKNN